MSQNSLTTKEVDFISDLMTLEESICKKAKIYSKTLTDVELASAMQTVAESHEKKFNSLLSMLG